MKEILQLGAANHIVFTDLCDSQMILDMQIQVLYNLADQFIVVSSEHRVVQLRVVQECF